ncbi:MAG: hypothetical protein Q8S31_09570 [Alphaproteobacteria bacterium]|nr:hypothetical protein [Alphaproteobacteria bacterium]
MKKIVIILWVLFSSPVFSAFAIISDNPDQLKFLPIEQLQILAKRKSTPEYLRVTACQRLMKTKNNEQEAFQILVNLLEQSNDASTIIPLLQEKEFLKLHHTKIVPLLLNYAKNTNIEEIKFNIPNTFFHNPEIKNIYCNELVDPILDLAKNANSENIKRNACIALLCDEKIKATHYNEIILLLLDLAKNAKNKYIATEIFDLLFVEIRREETCQDELILPLLERAKNEINVKYKYSYLSALWSNHKIKTLHYNELVLQFIDLIQKSTYTNIQEVLSLLEDDLLILTQYESVFRNVCRKLIIEYPENKDNKMKAYLLNEVDEQDNLLWNNNTIID